MVQSVIDDLTMLSFSVAPTIVALKGTKLKGRLSVEESVFKVIDLEAALGKENP